MDAARRASWFQDLSIKRKLILIGLLTSGFALFSVSLILAVTSWIDERNHIVSELTTYARVIGANVKPSLPIADRNAATEILSASLVTDGQCNFLA